MPVSAIHKIVATCVACVGATFAAPAIWNGTADVSWYESSAQAYNLTTAEQLAGLAKLVNQGTSSFEGKTITLGADIFLNDTTGAGAGTWASVSHTEWTPIGTSSRPFKGEFDGLAGKKVRKIYGLYINNASASYVGLFGYTNGVKFSNLDLLVGCVTGNDKVGALTGYALEGSVTNVHSEVKVVGKNSVGGLVGYYTGEISRSSVQENVAGQDSVGGLVGYTSGSIVGTDKGKSFFVGNVTGRKYVGGLAGYGAGVIKSYADGAVTGNSNYVGGVIGYATEKLDSAYHLNGNVKGASYIGGVAGYTTKSVIRIYSKENIDVIGTGDYVGGLVGYAVDSISNSRSLSNSVSGVKYVGGSAGYVGGSIFNLSSAGGVTGTSDYVGGVVGYATSSILSSYYYQNGAVNGKNYVGGLAGFVKESVSYCNSQGTVTGSGNYIGGLIGLALRSVNTTGATKEDTTYIKNSHFVGNVRGYRYVGGLIGLDSTHKILSNKKVNQITTSSNAKSRIVRIMSKNYSKGGVEGFAYVGGLIGSRKAGSDSSNKYISDYYIHSEIRSSYHSEGSVSADSSYVGGLVGSVINCLIDSSYHEGDVINEGGYVGGLGGYVNLPIKNSHSIGDITGTGSYIGGLVGYAGNSIDSSYYEGVIAGKGSYVGGIGGYVENAVKNSYSMGDVTGTGYYVGGLVGYAKSLIDSSNHEGGFVSGSRYVGGLVGYAGKTIGFSNHRSGSVSGDTYVGGLGGYVKNIAKNSHSTGDVIGATDYIGGVIGYSDSSISYSTHEDGAVSGGRYVGGLVGFVKGSVSYSSSQGTVTGSGNFVGGLIGLALRVVHTTGATKEDTTYIKNSHSIGDVRGYKYVGGLIGLDSIRKRLSSNKVNEITTSTNTKSRIVRIMSNNYSKGEIEGFAYVGGLIGSHSIGSDSSNKYISDAYIHSEIRSSYHSEGTVSADSSYVGGLVGYAESMIDASSHEGGPVTGKGYVGGVAGYITSSVTNSHSLADVTGSSDYVGGLVGLSLRSLNTTGASQNDTSYVKDSYSVGDIKGQNFVGGLIGLDSAYKLLTQNKGNDVNYSKKLVRIVSGTYSKGNVEGLAYVGGLIGKRCIGSDSSKYANTNYISSVIRSSYHSNGSVLGEGQFVGGLIGRGADSGIDSSYHEGGSVSGTGYVGGLAGYIYGGIGNSHSVCSVIGTSSSVGGLAGYARFSIGSSYHEGGSVSGAGSVGGVAGKVEGSVSNSYSEGNVEGTLDYVGGLTGYVGLAGSNIRNSYAKASYVRGRNHVGGLSGYVKNSIDVSYFEGDSVTGIYQVGGLAGYAGSAVDSSYSTAHVKGDDNVGGLIGSAYGDVSNSYALGNVVGDVDNSSAGNDNLGGLVGYQYSGSISKSLALGSVSGTTKLGGLAGRFDGTTISQSYANGDVTGSYYGDPADEVGNYYIGGLVGYAKGALEEIYASGVVKGIEDEPVYTGCVVGYVNGSLSVTKSYYDKTKCGLGIDGGENAASVSGTPGKTTAEMQTQSTFVNWDFVDTWKIYENTYPFLKIFTNSLTNAVVTTASLENIVYDGSAKTPIVTSVELFGETLTYGTDYTVAYKNNVDAGTATINVCGVNPYGGCKAINFVINAAAIVPTIASIEDVTYSGVALTPEIRVYNGGTLLTDADYTVEYTDNLNAGTASVTVTLKGNYSGSATKTFTIKKATPVISQNPTASNVINGQTLASSELTGGRADVEGAFVWQAPETVPTLENDGYVAVFVPADTLNYDSVETTVPVEVLDYVYVAVHVGDETLDSAVVIKGGNYTLPNAPDSVGYDFVGLYKGNAIVGNPGDVIVLNENTVIEAIYEAKTFAITFVNGDVVLQSENTAYGTLPEYRGETPTKTATAQYTYTFKGWKPTITPVTGAATYTAVFDSTVNKYMVTFKDGETVLQSGEVAYGTVPTAPAVTLPENTAQYTYSFGGWDSEVVAVMGPATYTAVINRTLNKYEVVFKDYDGSVLKSAVEYDYGTSADNVVKPSDPTRESTAQYTYTFKGWNPSIGDVMGAVVYTAEYDSTVRSYEIAFVNGSSTLQSGTVEYGQTPIYSGEAPTKTATAQYTYTFKGWSPAIASVAGATTYTAVFDSTVNKYIVTFMEGTTVLQSSEVAYGTVPTAPAVTLPENTAQYTYSFGGWDSEIVAVTGSATYTAVINRALNKYEVVFKDYDGSVLKSAVEYDYGTSAASIAKPANPTRGSTAQYTYTFKGWNPSIGDVMGAVVYTAEYDSTVRSYEIAFVNGSRTLQSGSVEYGQTPVYSGAAPTKTATAQYTYTFKGWNPAIASVTGAATYTAVFDSTVNKYTVTFKDGETVLQSGEVAYGTVPTAPAVTLPENTAQYSYSFDGWDSEIVAVIGPATYTAVINRTLNKYEVVFKDYDGSVLKSAVEYDYGTSADNVVKPSDPTRESTAQYTYTFKGWNPSIGDVMGAVVYTAEYDSTVRSYEIAFVNGSRTLQSGSVEYGQTPVYSGAAPTKTATAQYTYTFKGWNPAIASVTGAATYTAVFDSTVNKYMVTFKDGETVLQSGEVAYGTVPTAPAVTLPENTAKYTYIFKGWSPAITSVTGTATYTAVIDSTVNKCTITFKDGETVLQSGEVAYGTMPTVPAVALPENTAKYTYTFKGWSPAITSVTGAATYTAVIDSTLNKYTVTFKEGATVLQSSEVAYGAMPTLPKVILPENTAQYTYSFSWDKEIVSVTGPATYNVVVNRDISQYAVIFRDFDGILLGSALYDYGTSSANIVVPKDPTRAKSVEYTYTFKGWSPKITDVTGEAVYIAKYDSTKISAAIDSTDDGGDMPSITRNEILNNDLRIVSVSRNVQIAGAKVGSVYAILDMQGRVLKKGRVESANFNIPMAMAGNFLVRVGSRTQRISIR